MPTEAWPILNEMAVGQQIPAGLHCIIRLFWSRALAVSELAAAIELLLPPICTQRIERLLQPCPRCSPSILSRAKWAQKPRQYFSPVSNHPNNVCYVDIWSNRTRKQYLTVVMKDNRLMLNDLSTLGFTQKALDHF